LPPPAPESTATATASLARKKKSGKRKKKEDQMKHTNACIHKYDERCGTAHQQKAARHEKKRKTKETIN
jgi:hypothetical protein